MARNALQIGDDSDNPLSLAPWQVGDPTDPMAVAGAQTGVAGVDALGQWLAAQRAKSEARATPFWNVNNPIGTETTRPQQSVGMPDPSFRPGVFAGGGTVPMSAEQIDAFRSGSEGVYDQASLLAGVTPVAGGARAVSLGARRPLANLPPPAAPSAAVALGTGTPGRMKSGPVDVGDVTAHVNPSKADIARMMQSAPEHELRAFHDPEKGNFAIWPGWHAIHDDMRVPLGFTEDAVNMKLHGRVGPPDADYPGSAGRFSFFQTADPRPSRGR